MNNLVEILIAEYNAHRNSCSRFSHAAPKLDEGESADFTNRSARRNGRHPTALDNRTGVGTKKVELRTGLPMFISLNPASFVHWVKKLTQNGYTSRPFAFWAARSKTGSDRPSQQTQYNSPCAYAMFAWNSDQGASFPNPVGLAAGFDRMALPAAVVEPGLWLC